MEIWFYHLENRRLEEVLPSLLEKTLERGWRAVVQAGSRERLEALDNALWTYRDDSFLPHGSKRDGFPEQQPIFLTLDAENPNGANIRFVVEGADLPDDQTYDRVVYVFDGHDKGELGRARQTWKQAKDSGLTATYWRQTTTGRWEKQA